MTTPFLRQSDDRWKHDLLGSGTRTIWGAGCLLCCIEDAAHELGTADTYDPRDLNTIGARAGAFIGSSAKIPELARCRGLLAGDRIEGPASKLVGILAAAFDHGGLALLHVDDTPDDGKDDPAHWVLARRFTASGLFYSDPVSGLGSHLDPVLLTGASTWPDRRRYEVRALRVLSRLKSGA